ncbi:hypothetical protein JCM6882_004319 [Rhodosporidiobolus microsporus]
MSATDSSAEAAAMAAAAAIAVHDILTPIVVASFMSCALLGVLLSLIAQYYSKFPNDRLPFRVLVGVLCVLALVDTGNEAAWAYRYAVLDFGNAAALAEWPTVFSIFAFITATSIYICQLFFIWRSWVVGGRGWVNCALTALLLLLATAAAGCVYAMAVTSVKDSWTQLTDFNPLLNLIQAWLGLGFAVDLLITGSLLWHLVFRPRKIGTEAPSSALTRIAILAVKTYCVCVVATLNARNPTHTGTSYGEQTSRQKGLGAGNSFALPDRTQVTVHTTVRRDVEEDSQFKDGYEPSVPHNPYTVFVLDDNANGMNATGGMDSMEKGKAMRTDDSF